MKRATFRGFSCGWMPLVLAALVVGACGGGGDADSAPADTSPAAPAAPAFDESTAGSVQGTVSHSNGDDPDTAIRMTADPVCNSLHSAPVYSETLVRDDSGNLANVFVYVKTGLEGYNFEPPAEAALIEQEGCVYLPHVSGAMVGQTVKITNKDALLHNVHATPTLNDTFNAAQPFKDMELDKSFDKVEVMIPFKCDVHPWMSSYLGVLDHPYFAVSGADGSFAIDKLPPGSYTLEAWHETLGSQTQEVTLEANGSVDVSFTF